ncbi:MAG TPA: isoprenylcysteine carboxylmethyltransferase family protein [Gemmatimonadaceae bacterium]
MVAETQPSLLERWGTFLFKYRDAVFPAVILATIVATRPVFPNGSRTADLWLDLIGILVAAAGQALRITVIGYRYIVRGGKNRKVHAEDLVTEGIFGLARNPLYVGNILVLFGIFIIWNAPLLYLIGVPFTLIGYKGIVAAEEAFLRGKFGAAYDEYCRTTNRWIPDFRKAPEALRGISFNWRRVLLREYGSWTAWIGTAGAMIIAESLYAAPYEDQATLINAIIGVLLVVLIAWAVTRWLKLNKRIRA